MRALLNIINFLSIVLGFINSNYIVKKFHKSEFNNDDPIEDFYSYYLQNEDNIYYVNTNIGSNDQLLRLVLDTQRRYISISGRNCTYICKAGSFDETKSNSFKLLNDDDYKLVIYNDELVGKLGSDKIKIHELVSDSFPLFIISSLTKSMEFKIDGYLGLGFSKVKENNIIYQLFKSGIIKNAYSGYLFLSQQEESYIHIGGYDKTIINQTNYVETEVKFNENDNFTEWYIEVDKVLMKNLTVNETQKIIINSSSNIIRIPKKFFFEYKNQIFDKKSECQMMKDNVFHCKCDDNYSSIFPNITFNINNYTTLYISPEEYIFADNSQMDDSTNCILFVSLNYMNDYWILGTNFFNNYYTIFDYENNKIKFKDIRTRKFINLSSTLIFCLIILSCSIIFFTVIYLIYKRIINRRAEYNRLN